MFLLLFWHHKRNVKNWLAEPLQEFENNSQNQVFKKENDITLTPVLISCQYIDIIAYAGKTKVAKVWELCSVSQ